MDAGIVRNPAFGFTLRRGVGVVSDNVFVLFRGVHNGYFLSWVDCFRECPQSTPRELCWDVRCARNSIHIAPRGGLAGQGRGIG